VTRTICLHGPESTGKTTVAPLLAARLGGAIVGEYGREYAETHGTAFTMPDLVAIGQEQARRAAAAKATGADPLILDTDPLMTAVWADMLFGRRDPWFNSFTDTADLYLLFDTDLPWIDDGTRLFGTIGLRRRFFDLSKAELDRRGLKWALVGGEGEARLDNAITAIRAAGLG
jgi:NadR type nicotinamide-nucleotide adenylyltransferase